MIITKNTFKYYLLSLFSIFLVSLISYFLGVSTYGNVTFKSVKIDAFAIFFNNLFIFLFTIFVGIFYPVISKISYWFNIIRFLIFYLISISIHGILPVLNRLLKFGLFELLAMAISIAIPLSIIVQHEKSKIERNLLFIVGVLLLLLAAIIESGIIK